MPSPVSLPQALASVLDRDQILTRPIDLAAFASDASVYRIVPAAVVRPRDVAQVRAVLQAARSCGTAVGFRAAGTSLSGQAVTPGVLIDLSRHWRGIEVLDGGARVRVEPGAVGAAVNARLVQCGARIGPDPASIQACMMGGILANNSSGMCCGVAQNAYHTLDSLVFLLPSGTLVDSAAPDAGLVLREQEPAIHQGLLDLRREVLGDVSLAERIRAKYRMKNTTGYSINALLDYERPVEILRHLLVGSEGTLAFIASAVLRTIADRPVKHTGLLLFPDIRAACAAIVPLKEAGAAAIEVMDRAAMRSVEEQAGVPAALRGLPPKAAGLLVEFQAPAEGDRAALHRAAALAVRGLTLLEAPAFTDDPAEQLRLWKVRQGMFPSVGATRPRGTAVLIEDVAFPVERLAEAVTELQALLQAHGYDTAIIFGHAREGNLHFVITQSFNDRGAVARYARFMDELVRLVAGRYGGALKAEHGTGRNIAPFVEAEWGADAYRVMRRVKALVDPGALLNPGVLITDDPREHLQHLKGLPVVESEVDACIECGYCEPRCPSRDLTLTPRQRIVVRRQIARLESAGDAKARAGVEVDFPYEALDTCAADGLCATECPVGIDTGQLTKRLRASRHTAAAQRTAAWVGRHMRLVERSLRAGLGAAGVVRRLGGGPALALASGLPRALGLGTPRYVEPMPGAARWPAPAGAGASAEASAVYFPSCLSRTLGHLPGEPRELTLVEAMTRVAARAGAPLLVPPDTDGHCCGVPFSSKGYHDAHAATVNRTVEAFWRWTGEGRLPVVVDTSPCTYGLRSCRAALTPENQARFDRLTILDGVEHAASLLARLPVRRRRRRVVLHPVCSLVKMNLVPDLLRIARACADEAVLPLDAGCCAFAGDRGWLVPELTRAATAREAAEVAATPADGYFSSSRTCEIGLTRATGEVYRSYVYLLEWATRESETGSVT
ncbi:MAG: linked oxidase-like protein [Acidobacteria bacterium]|nr:linked oxidase-like protein [Acidobacteriota bacterium]